MTDYSWTTPHRRGFVCTPLGQLHYLTAGSGPVLTLLHQSPSSARMYSELLTDLESDFRLIAFDTPGFGESDALPGEPPMEALGRAIASGLATLGVSRTFLLGHHTGASLAVEVATAHSGLVERLIVFGLPDYGDDAGKATRRAAIQPAQLDPAGGHLTAIWDRVRGRAADLPLEQVNRLVLEQIRPGSRSHLGSLAVVDYDIRARLPFLSMPTLLLAGQRDRFWIENQETVTLIPHGRLEAIENASHLVCAEQPAEFAAAVRRFLLR